MRYFLLNKNRLDENDFECNIFEYYYDVTLVTTTFTSNIRNEYTFFSIIINNSSGDGLLCAFTTLCDTILC